MELFDQSRMLILSKPDADKSLNPKARTLRASLARRPKHLIGTHAPMAAPEWVQKSNLSRVLHIDPKPSGMTASSFDAPLERDRSAPTRRWRSGRVRKPPN
jgi:hypothetical protein